MRIKVIFYIMSVFFLLHNNATAAVREYSLTISKGNVNHTGNTVRAMTVNGTIPGPTLRFKEGDVARIHVQNKMDVETSVHWHGILLPNLQDGVPYITTPPILPGTSFTYEFPIKHSGTYWYHSHTGLQEQQGVYGSIVIEPQSAGMKTDIDHVVVLSDWTDENPNEVLRTLKSGNGYYSLKKGSVQSLFGALSAGALPGFLKRSWSRMPPMDISDIAYDRFLVNGKPSVEIRAAPGQTVRLRIINAAASTYFYLQYAGGQMRIISADGVDVQPADMVRFLIAVAETYDVIIPVPESGAYEFRATAQDGSGFTSLFVGSGNHITAPDIPKPDLYRMHSGDHGNNENGMTEKMQHDSMDSMMHHADGMEMAMAESSMAPYEYLISPVSTALSKEKPLREIALELTGDMERYVWSMNGKTLNEADVIKIKKGENVRFILVNMTMMHHPMHLHGHFFRVVNKYGDFSPMKHTVDVPPLGTRIIEFYADEEKDWFFHCHILYHMKAGMARIVHYEGSEIDAQIAAIRPNLYKEDWYAWADASFLTQMTNGRAVAADTRNTLTAEWEAGWTEDYEAAFAYERYFTRFFQVFGGGVLTNGGREDRWIAGVHYLLPFLLESTVWLDSEGGLRLVLDKKVHLTDRLYAFGEYQYDTESKEEWLAGAGLMLNKHISIIGQYHSEYKGGIGVNILF